MWKAHKKAKSTVKCCHYKTCKCNSNKEIIFVYSFFDFLVFSSSLQQSV